MDVITSESSGKTRGYGDGGTEGVAGREGGGGDVGESHGNSEEKQTTSYGRTDTNGIGPTKILIMFRH